jgi:hypothetical protein
MVNKRFANETAYLAAYFAASLALATMPAGVA